ncbi:MAG: AI-2E family transporter [Thiobacillaceae bacterium]|nr:AI-2E family transporter [Thiobacillaceae bacterium]
MTATPLNRTRLLVYVVLAAGLGYLLHLLAPILTPFLIAVALAYLCDPLVDRLGRLRLPRTLATVVVMLALLLLALILFAILAPMLRSQLVALMQQLPVLIEWVERSLLPWAGRVLGAEPLPDQAGLAAWLRAHLATLGALGTRLPGLVERGFALVWALTGLLLVPVVLFYLLRDWNRLLAALAEWIPLPVRPRVTQIVSEIDAVLAQFVRAQLAVMLIMAAVYALGLWLIGLDYALAVGVVSGLLVFIPYLGLVVGVALGTLSAWVQFGELAALIQVWAVYAVGHLLESMVITPALVGERLGLHPVAVIFALLACGHLFGFFGVLLAIPAAAAVLVVMRHLKAGLAGR